MPVDDRKPGENRKLVLLSANVKPTNLVYAPGENCNGPKINEAGIPVGFMHTKFYWKWIHAD
jgi:hypothetical protein